MKNFYYEGQRFKNGNINVRFSPEEIEDINAGKNSGAEILCWKLDMFDTVPIGETYCLSNFTTGHTFYSYYSDRVFIVDWSDLHNVLMQGKTLKLYAMVPDETDIEIINAEA